MVIDTSAMVAILADEPETRLFLQAIHSAPIRRLSAACAVELAIVLSQKDLGFDLARLDGLLTSMGVVIEAVSPQQASIARAAFLAYGKGRHPARLNFGDTFSYALAQVTGEPLLFKGEDFARTDITPAV